MLQHAQCMFVLIRVLVYLRVLFTLGTCPTGWLQHQSTCVLLDAREKLTWNEAKGYCTLRGTTMLEMIK